MKLVRRAPVFAIVVLALACNDDPYPNKSQVSSVRILAVRADLPYARPGETVKLEALVADGRSRPTLPLRTMWFPVPCVDPPGGQYYDCYPALEARFPIGVDLTPELAEGTTHAITIPADALANVAPEPGRSGEPIVTAWTFMFACAGHVERIARSSRLAENAAPFACFGADGEVLPAEEAVFGFTRVAVTATRRNAIPTLKSLVVRGRAVDPEKGISLPRCDRDLYETITDEDCNGVGMAIAFDDADAEIDPDNVGPDGRPGRETIYSDWYVTFGRFRQARRIERDPFKGRPEIPDTLYEPPRSPVKGTLWAVLHDNRGGTSWTSVPIEIR
ncbi:MAG: hypothetical protein KF795_30180 [Labilithrix sp.]|nr:hypothetical protein [Labilithrix sp.]